MQVSGATYHLMSIIDNDCVEIDTKYSKKV